MTAYSESELQAVIDERLLWRRADRAARRLLDAEEHAGVDLDALYLDGDQLEQMQPAPPLIAEVLPRHSYGILRGRDHSFKSFVALSWSLCLASGLWWHGRPVERVPVLYIAGEGAYGLRLRKAAWEHVAATKVPPDWFTVRTSALDMYSPGPAFEHLLEHVAARGYGLVVVDTLRKVSGTADGNGSDMGPVVDSLLRLKDATAGGSVLVLTHTDKGDHDTRGFSGIEDDADFVWHIRREGEQASLDLTKMKDGPDGTRQWVRAQPVLESLAIVPCLAPAEVTESLTDSANQVLRTLRETFPDGAYSGQLHDASGLAKATFHRALAVLKKANLVVNSGSHQRPFYEAPGLTGSAEVSGPDSPADLHGSHLVSLGLNEVSPVSRPLGSETARPETCACGVPVGAQVPHLPNCPGPHQEANHAQA